MPYIPQVERKAWQSALAKVASIIVDRGMSNGDLNYLMTKLALYYIIRHGKSYNTLSDVIKAFECAKLEFYRRHVAPYEDRKITQNGDII